jgi:N-dimethylarginine dimethylaminohydrolase
MLFMKLLMCRPDYFDVTYSINDWMDINDPVDKNLAKQQWEKLYQTYLDLGYEVELIEPVEGLPDMVFTANGGLIYRDKTVLPHFKHQQRQGETPLFEKWFRKNLPSNEVLVSDGLFEGEGDALFVGGKLFGGYGFRSSKEEYAQIAEFLGAEVVPLQLVDPRFYHFDTCFSVLDSQTVAYYPGAFSDEAIAAIDKHMPNTIQVAEKDAEAFGLNMFSDGKNAVVAMQAEAFRNELENRGYNVIPVDVSEFRKSGGGIKCLTLLLEQIHKI